jgi:D-cysteine desulfhydrase family pyridoxal phosphate-dependent enzyme
MIKKETFAHLPTKVEALDRLTKVLAGPDILIKRDDQTGLALGGNKTRKLEYLIADAISQGADTVLTTGAAQSNHCRQTAAAAARCGLDCKLVLVGPEPKRFTSNLFLDRLLKAEIIWTEKAKRDQTLDLVYQKAKNDGSEPYLIPYGGSNALGAYAFLKAFEELEDQLLGEMPDWIVLASSSGGTQAGLWLGSQMSGSSTRILGISVDEPEDIVKDNIYQIACALSEHLHLDLDLNKGDISVNDGYIGDGYGMMNANDREAIQIFAKHEAILLDPVYTGRAGAGLIDLIRSKSLQADQRVLFWHTGGTPALFADKYLSDII